MAYCLLGLFDVNMPLLYGEGDKAFYRLQLEILRQSDDESLFAWEGQCRLQGMLAPHPAAFGNAGDIESALTGDPNEYFDGFAPASPLKSFTPNPMGIRSYAMTNKGLEMTCVGQSVHLDFNAGDFFTLLNLKCWRKDRKPAGIQVFFWRPGHSDEFYRLRTLGPLSPNSLLLPHRIRDLGPDRMLEHTIRVWNYENSPWDLNVGIPPTLPLSVFHWYPPNFDHWVEANELKGIGQ